jgi:hypothetical protein
MSNPAVIILDNLRTKNGKFNRFVLEDNIGESIHLHVDDMRIDFTINEFLNFSNLIRNSLKELNVLKGYNIEKFDESFLRQCSEVLPNLIEIKKETINLKDLKVIGHYKFKDLTLQKIVSILKAPAYSYLKGKNNNFSEYLQFNYLSISNKQRLLKLRSSIEKDGYPFDERYIVMFNDQNLIRDGQHRAVVLAYLYGLDYEIEILRFYFKGTHHFFRARFSNYKKIIIWFLRKIYNKAIKP